jgi:hypothetical protein
VRDIGSPRSLKRGSHGFLFLLYQYVKTYFQLDFQAGIAIANSLASALWRKPRTCQGIP